MTGTPGVGKSCFLDYVLHLCLYDANENVLYLHGPCAEANHLFQHVNGGTISVTTYNLADVLTVSGAIPSALFDIVLFDAHENLEDTNTVSRKRFQGKKFIVALLPDEENCKKLRKDVMSESDTLYMGTLSRDEAEDMRSSCFRHVSGELLQSRYGIIDGILEFVRKIEWLSIVVESDSETEKKISLFCMIESC